MNDVPNEILQRAYRRRPLYLVKLPFFYGVIAVFAYIAWWGTTHTQHGLAIAILCGALASVLQRGIGSIGHDAVHGAISRNKLVTYVVGLLSWSATLFPYTVYRAYHLDHHKIVNEPDDIDRVQVSRWTSNPTLARILRIAIYMGAYPIYYAITVQRYTRKLPWYLQLRAYAETALVGLVLFGVYKLMGSAAFFPFILTEMIMGAFVVGITSMAEHFDIAYDEDHSYSSRTYGTESKLMDFLWSGTNFHVEHHKYPGIPYYNLRAFHFEAYPHYSERVKKNVYKDFWPMIFSLWKKASQLTVEEERERARRDRELLESRGAATA